MPEYHDISNFQEYSITISAVSKRRNLFRKWPYYAGDKISLRIVFTPLSNKAKADALDKIVVVFCHPDPISGKTDIEYFNMGQKNGVGIVQQTSHVIGATGTFKVYPAFKLGGYVPEPYLNLPLFTAEITHKDRLRYDLFLIFIGFA